MEKRLTEAIPKIVTNLGNYSITEVTSTAAVVDRLNALQNEIRGYTPDFIKQAVVAGVFVQGELIGNSPGGEPNMRFVDANYRYEFMLSAADTDYTYYVWVRTVKGIS
jgi:hypothetical protein